MTKLSYDRESVRFLISLGGEWISDEKYLRIFHVSSDTVSDLPHGVRAHYNLGINCLSLAGERCYDEVWEDLMEEIESAGRINPEMNLGATAFSATGMIGGLWNKHKTLESALDMVEAILDHPVRLRNGGEWVTVLDRRFGVPWHSIIERPCF